VTTPAQQGSGSSASGSASASASPQPVTIAKDSVTPGTSVTGLAGVLAEADAGEVAAGIARAVGAAVTEAAQGAQANIQEIRVIGDLSVLGDVTTLEIMSSQVAQLTGQVAEYVKAVPDAVAPPPPRTGLKGEKIAEFLGVGDAANALGSLAGTITQLVAGTYTYSGQAVPSASVGGLDILTARALAPRVSVPVRVDRFTMPGAGQILDQVQKLVTKAASDLNQALTRAAAAAAARAQVVADDKDRLTELDAELTAVQKGSPLDPAALRAEYDKVSARLPGESEDAAAAQNLLSEGQALANAITAFVSAAVTAPTAGGPAPVTRAAHGELLSKDGTALLYAQVIAAGDDQVLRQTLIHNTWSNLTGLTAEYALLLPGREALAFGLESAFAVAHGSVRKGLTDIARKKVTLRDG
jgi:hypothetical protein